MPVNETTTTKKEEAAAGTAVTKGAEPQAVDVITNVFEDATVQAKNKNASVESQNQKTSSRGGKKGGKHSKGTSMGLTRTEQFSYDVDSRSMRRAARCGGCLNEMTSSKKWNAHTEEFKDKVVPQTPSGEYKFKSPGVKEGAYGSQLCDNCETKYKRGEPISFHHVTVIDQEGSVRNMEVSQLAAFEVKKPIRAPA